MKHSRLLRKIAAIAMMTAGTVAQFEHDALEFFSKHPKAHHATHAKDDGSLAGVAVVSGEIEPIPDGFWDDSLRMWVITGTRQS
jgi:hypothetical protein